jgi:hypothetical protein
MRFFATLRMTEREGLRVTQGEGLSQNDRGKMLIATSLSLLAMTMNMLCPW